MPRRKQTGVAKGKKDLQQGHGYREAPQAVSAAEKAHHGESQELSKPESELACAGLRIVRKQKLLDLVEEMQFDRVQEEWAGFLHFGEGILPSAVTSL